LPRRVRQAQLASQLKPEKQAERREADQASAAGPESADAYAEQSRALLNSLQAGWRRGRAGGERDGEEV
jgi:hypothetical protein